MSNRGNLVLRRAGLLGFAAAALTVAVQFAFTPTAQAQTQASGSIIVSPSAGQNCATAGPPPGPDVLAASQSITINVQIFNTSTIGGVGAIATITGTTTIFLACTDSTCATELASLTFDSCAGASGVTCVLDGSNSNHVLITYGAGKALAAGSATMLATITAHAEPGEQILTSACGTFAARGVTGANDIHITGASGQAAGSAPLNFPGFCGDGVFQPELGEQCDDGNSTAFDGCGIPGGGNNNCQICVDSTTCPDTDNNECTTAGCEAGFCVQTHVFIPDSTPCTDTDGSACTTAGCNGAGTCDQNHIVKTCPSDECNTGVCNAASGLCTPVPASTACTDTDNNDCTTAGCELSNPELGICVQTHVLVPDSTPCTDNDNNACTTAGCNGAGTCDQNHVVKTCPSDECNTGTCGAASGLCVPVPASTACTDTDGNDCTTAGCELSNPELGICVQTHVLVPDSSPCSDTDGNSCTTAGCNGAGVCDQNHLVCPPTATPTNTPTSTPTRTPTRTPTQTATNTAAPAGGCRVTGGGRLAGSETFPMVSFATHGGQVGASLGVPTAFSLNSPCISGQWQHVRHGNSGNFHASTFDSLNCACLSCNGGNAGGQLCPGSCGPQPPNAPANKICFSGPGNYTATNGPKSPSVVFRADVEDHGEPGRNDRYRIRIWFVDPTSAAGLALRQAVACGDPTTETVNTALAPDVDDGGTLDTGNQQIHKPTGRKCKL